MPEIITIFSQKCKTLWLGPACDQLPKKWMHEKQNGQGTEIAFFPKKANFSAARADLLIPSKNARTFVGSVFTSILLTYFGKLLRQLTPPTLGAKRVLCTYVSEICFHTDLWREWSSGKDKFPKPLVIAIPNTWPKYQAEIQKKLFLPSKSRDPDPFSQKNSLKSLKSSVSTLSRCMR